MSCSASVLVYTGNILDFSRVLVIVTKSGANQSLRSQPYSSSYCTIILPLLKHPIEPLRLSEYRPNLWIEKNKRAKWHPQQPHKPTITIPTLTQDSHKSSPYSYSLACAATQPYPYLPIEIEDQDLTFNGQPLSAL